MVSKILVIEDETELREFLRQFLLENNYSVDVASNGAGGIGYIKKNKPDIVILDLGLPDIDGNSVCVEIKKEYPDLPVIILTARHTTEEVVNGLNYGADDYVTKPFSKEELLARIKARLRNNDKIENELKVGDLVLNRSSMEVRRGNRLISLTKTEFDLLEFLMVSKGKVLTRETILNRIWLYSPDIESRVVDVYVGYLRKKIDAGSSKKLIQSVRGFGYTIKED